MAKTPTSKVKSTTSSGRSAAVKRAGRPDEHQIRERAYGIWIEEGRPEGREHAHW
jgi:Protein of unknown function (DUF2934)